MNKVLAVLGIIVSILVIAFVILWFTWLRGRVQVKQFIDKGAVEEKDTFKTLQPEERKLIEMTPKEEAKFIEKQEVWKDALEQDKPADVVYNTKDINRLIERDMISENIKPESFILKVENGFLTGQASVRNPLDPKTWLNLNFKVTIVIKDFYIQSLNFDKLSAVKEGETIELGDDGKQVVMIKIKDFLQKSLDGNAEAGGAASDLFYVKDCTIAGNDLNVVYDPQRYKTWVEARRVRREREEPPPPPPPPPPDNTTPVPPPKKPASEVF
jgi:hypothetical protein